MKHELMSPELACYFMGRDETYAKELTDNLLLNAERTVQAYTELLNRFGQKRDVNSGWRPALVNATTPGAAIRSKHVLCLAVDLDDPDGDLDDWAMNQPDILTELNLWQEHPSATKGWAHFQIVPYASWVAGKRRWFYP